jgi:hypothetical protein
LEVEVGALVLPGLDEPVDLVAHGVSIPTQDS